MFQALAIPLATTIAGYGIDKMMGGSGMTGAGIGFTGGTMGADGGKGAAAGAGGAASTIPAHLISQTAPTVAANAITTGSTALGSSMAADLASGIGSSGTPLIEAIPNAFTRAAPDSIGADTSMFFNPESGNFMSKDYFVPGNSPTANNGLLDTISGKIGDGYDYLKEGFSDMSLKEQAELGLMGLNSALPNDQPLNTQVTPLAVSPTQYQPNLLDINISGVNDMNQNQLTEEQLRALGLLQRG